LTQVVQTQKVFKASTSASDIKFYVVKKIFLPPRRKADLRVCDHQQLTLASFKRNNSNEIDSTFY